RRYAIEAPGHLDATVQSPRGEPQDLTNLRPGCRYSYGVSGAATGTRAVLGPNCASKSYPAPGNTWRTYVMGKASCHVLRSSDRHAAPTLTLRCRAISRSALTALIRCSA